MSCISSRLTRFVSLLVISALLISSLPTMAFAQNEPSSQESSSSKSSISVHPTRVVQNRTSEFCTTYEMSDGSYQAKFSQTPLNYLNKDGIWREIDTNLSKETTTVGQQDLPALALTPALSKKILVLFAKYLVLLP